MMPDEMALKAREVRRARRDRALLMGCTANQMRAAAQRGLSVGEYLRAKRARREARSARRVARLEGPVAPAEPEESQ